MVTIVKNSAGEFKTASQSTAGNAWIRLTSSEVQFVNGRPSIAKRSAIINQIEEVIDAVLAGAKGDTLPGKICVQEFVASAVPVALVGTKNREENIKRAAKVNPQTGEILTKNGEVICRFQMYDPNCTMPDIFVQHDATAAAPAAAPVATTVETELPVND